MPNLHSLDPGSENRAFLPFLIPAVALTSSLRGEWMLPTPITNATAYYYFSIHHRRHITGETWHGFPWTKRIPTEPGLGFPRSVLFNTSALPPICRLSFRILRLSIEHLNLFPVVALERPLSCLVVRFLISITQNEVGRLWLLTLRRG